MRRPSRCPGYSKLIRDEPKSSILTCALGRYFPSLVCDLGFWPCTLWRSALQAKRALGICPNVEAQVG